MTSVFSASRTTRPIAGKRRIPPISVNSGSSLTRFISCTERPTSDTIAPCMMSAGATPCERWLITSDSANTAHTPEMAIDSFDVSTSGPISSVANPM